MNPTTHTYHIPRANPKRPTWGLTHSDNRWIIHYYRDGKLKQKRISATTEAEAIAMRDAYFARLTELGATPKPHATGNQRRADKRRKHPDFGIRSNSYTVAIGSRYIGSFKTIEQARAARDKALREEGGGA